MDGFPWFPLDVADWLTSPTNRMMGALGRGVHIDLLAYSWMNGPIPDDVDAVAALVGMDATALRSHWPRIRAAFENVPDDPSMMVSPRLEEARADAIEAAETRRRAGRKGAQARWNKGRNGNRIATAKQPHSDGNATGKRLPHRSKSKEMKDDSSESSLSAGGGSWSSRACDVWVETMGGTAPGGRIGKALKPLVSKHGEPEVLKWWRVYLENRVEGGEMEYATAEDFAQRYGVYVDQLARKGKAGGTKTTARQEYTPDDEAGAFK